MRMFGTDRMGRAPTVQAGQRRIWAGLRRWVCGDGNTQKQKIKADKAGGRASKRGMERMGTACAGVASVVDVGMGKARETLDAGLRGCWGGGWGMGMGMGTDSHKCPSVILFVRPEIT